MSLLTLGVETSGMTGAIALRRDGRTAEFVSLQQSGRRHAQTLISEVDAMLRRADVTSRQLDVVSVSIGPGSFTGLRVGVVFAKSLAYAVGCRLVAVDTFRAIAAACPKEISEVFVVSDAQRNDLFVGRYCRRNSAIDPARVGEIGIESVDSFCRKLNEFDAMRTEVAISGSAAAIVHSAMSSSVRILSPEFQLPRADFIAELGEQQALAGDLSDPWQLEPFYLRRSAAEEKKVS